VSKAFTKDDDAGAAPLVAPRAPLPPGVTNYVTPEGLAALRDELASLLEARAELGTPELDAARAATAAGLAERIAELEGRIACAELVAPPEHPPDVVRFGARVTVRTRAGTERVYRIVGIDEANATEGRIAFVAPLARALLGKRVGDAALVRTPHGEEELEVAGLEYARRE
jgi:transcription elongation factor GreB